MNYLGDFPTGATVYVPFHTFASTGASVTLTGLAVTDIEIYKNGGTTQRSSDAGYTLLDTDGIDFDGITGLHGFSIDLSDNTDAGFYAAGNEYQVAVSSVTVDSQTVNFWSATFSIERSGAALSLLKNATYGLSALETIVDDLEGRLTATRAGHLDNLSAGAVALEATAQSILTDTGTTLDGLIQDLPTNAELATALGTADDAVLAAIAALNNLSQANIRTAVGLATANLDTQLAALPSAVENADAILSRGFANVEDAAELGSIAELLMGAFESAVVGTTWTIRKSGGTTFNTRTLTTSAAAEPITSVT